MQSMQKQSIWSFKKRYTSANEQGIGHSNHPYARGITDLLKPLWQQDNIPIHNSPVNN
ncbi:hypothetical protein [Candidatus Liberibacter solanacearum]|uniref:hypothetical protein n=1 Tax=Candidatus Liberibacter solanacearum TaxID=556287 RepID=UPI00161C87F2|nr:hypothetical protein [Candidatus Liberibacter solanacearum]